MSVLHVVFKVGTGEYVLPASDVLQMESYTGATRVPGSRPYVAGIVQVRGKVVPVVDARARFGLPEVERGLDARIVVSQLGDRTVALLVDSGREVLKVDPESLKPPPPLLSGEAQGFVKAVAQVGQRLVMLIDLEKVVGEETIHAQ
jgi:purine-binding chemotaxis protein CheW